MYEKCRYERCVWEVLRSERTILCMFHHCVEGRPADFCCGIFTDDSQRENTPKKAPSEPKEKIRPP